MRTKLTLKPKVDPATKPKVDPAKLSLSESLGMRFVDRGGRYIMQKLVVSYGITREAYFNKEPPGEYVRALEGEISRTWIDVPLVPEAYYP